MLKLFHSFLRPFGFLPILALAITVSACAAGGSGNTGAPGETLPGQTFNGPVIDKSGDSVLQALIADVAPKFKQGEFTANGQTISYSLFAPEKIVRGKKYPLVVFIGDASTVGADLSRPLLQGYGALSFASKEAQAKNPCYVLVPQFSEVAVNDAYESSSEAALVPLLTRELAKTHAVNKKKIYISGQSMGGMLGMEYMANDPGLYAAGLFVDSHWKPQAMDKLVTAAPFIFVYAGDQGKAYKCEQAIEEACRKMSRSYAWAEWSARLPKKTQDDLASNLLGKGNPVNLVGFENGTVLPEGASGSEHMYSFDKAYQLAPFREWLFKQKMK